MRMYKLSVNNNEYDVTVKKVTPKEATVEVNGVEKIVTINEIKNLSLPKATQEEGPRPVYHPSKTGQSAPQIKKVGGQNGVKAPIPGQIKAIFVKQGDKITSGQKVLIMEAMKMENVINSNCAGTVKRVLVGNGDTVNQDQLLVEIGD